MMKGQGKGATVGKGPDMGKQIGDRSAGAIPGAAGGFLKHSIKAIQSNSTKTEIPYPKGMRELFPTEQDMDALPNFPEANLKAATAFRDLNRL